MFAGRPPPRLDVVRFMIGGAHATAWVVSILSKPRRSTQAFIGADQNGIEPQPQMVVKIGPWRQLQFPQMLRSRAPPSVGRLSLMGEAFHMIASTPPLSLPSMGKIHMVETIALM